MKILDLFCGAGGAAMGMHQALEEAGIKHHIVGHDNDADVLEYYPFDGKCSDVLQLTPAYLSTFDFIWASPPCQAYSISTIPMRRHGRKYADVIAPVRELLMASGRPFVIENNSHAPIRHDLLLCGTMFGLKVIRHRHFELGGGDWTCAKPFHPHHTGMRLCQDVNGRAKINQGYISVFGHGHHKDSLNVWRRVMETPWIGDRGMIAEAVPPAYSRYIMREFLEWKDRP